MKLLLNQQKFIMILISWVLRKDLNFSLDCSLENF